MDLQAGGRRSVTCPFSATLVQRQNIPSRHSTPRSRARLADHDRERRVVRLRERPGDVPDPVERVGHLPVERGGELHLQLVRGERGVQVELADSTDGRR